MTSWDYVETGFDGNETVNFGPRSESGSALYQLDTKAVISANDAQKQGNAPPSVCGYAVDDKLCVAVEQYLSAFSDDGHSATICFDSCLECLISSDDKRFLFVAEADGRLHFFHQSSSNSLFSMNLKDDQSNSTFVKLILRPASVTGLHELLVVVSSGRIHVISNINLSSLHDAITENDAAQLQQLTQDLISPQIDCSNIHSVVTGACSVPNSSSRQLVVAAEGGPMALSIWEMEKGSGEYTLYAHIDHHGGVDKCEVSPCGKYLIALGRNGVLSFWSAKHLIQLKNLETGQVTDFRILESTSCSTMKIVIVCQDNDGCYILEVRDFISFEAAYTLRLDAKCYLMPCSSDEKSIFLLENVLNSQNQVSSLRVRCVSEADFENRVANLLKKKKFQQAEEFSDTYNLNKEIVFKMKANHLFELLSTNSHVDSVDADILELERCLQQIRDDDQVAHSCMKAALPTYKNTFRFLQMAQQRLITSSQKASCSQLLSQLMGMMRRLTTFKSVYGEQNYSPVLWQQFKTIHLLDEVRHRLMNDDFPSAASIWMRHRNEFASALSLADFEGILDIPLRTTSQELLPWLKDVIQLALSVLPESIASIASWIEQKMRAMEIVEKGAWPENALEFGRSLLAAASNAPWKGVELISQHFSNSASVETKKAFVGVGILSGQLENLVALRDKYKFSLSLDEFSVETVESIVFRLLDRVVASELLDAALTNIVFPYVKEKNLSPDQMLLAYIKDLIERSCKQGVTIGEASWESLAVAIVHCIVCPDLKCEGILCIMSRANVPWSERLQRLIQKGLDLNHSKSADIEKQCGLMQLQKLLSDYEIHQTFHNASMAETAIYNILTRDRPSAMDDAFQVQRAFNLHESKVYNFRILFLVKNDRMSDVIALLRELPVSSAVIYGEVLLGRSGLVLKQTMFRDEPEMALMTQASIVAAKVLLSREGLDSEKRDDFERALVDWQCIQSLQVEFKEYISLTDLASKVFTQELLAKYVEEYHDQKEKEKKCLPKLFRLAELVAFPADKLVFELAQFLLKQGHMSDAIGITRDFLRDHPTEKSAQAAYNVAHLTTTHLGSSRDLTFDPELVNEVHDLAGAVLSCCAPELLQRSLQLTQLTQLGHLLSVQSSDCSTSSKVTEVKNSFNTWTFSAIFEEDGLVMDAEITAPLFHGYVDEFLLHEPTAKSCESAMNLVRMLKENSQRELALYFVQHSMHCHGYNACIDSTDAEKCKQSYDEFCRISEAGIKESFDLALSLLQKVFSKSRIDHHFAFGILSSFPKLTAYSSLKTMISKAAFNYKRIMSLTDGGITLAAFNSDLKYHLDFKNLQEIAEWGVRLKQYEIAFDSVYISGTFDSKHEILTQLCQVSDVEVGTIQEYCQTFGLDGDEALLKFLEFLLLPRKYDPSPKEVWLRLHEAKARKVVRKMANKDLLMQRLQTILNEINMYDYERLHFVLSILDKLNASPFTTKGLQVLEYLQSYKRVSPPGDFEAHYHVTEEDELMGKSPLKNCEVNLHLPVHPLLQGHPWKIISPELNMKTVESWLLIAAVIGLPTDNIYMTTIKNLMQDKKENQFESARSLVMRMSDCKKAVQSASWIAQQLEFGADKVKALKFTMELAEMWAKACGDKQSGDRNIAVKSLMQYKQLHLRLSIEHALHEHNLNEQDLMDLVSAPEPLILALYCHPRILDYDTDPNHPDFHAVATVIAELAQVDLMSLHFSLIEKWLPSTAKQDNLDQTLNLDVSLIGGLDGTLRTDVDVMEDEENLIRLRYLLHNTNREKNVTFLLNYAFREKSATITTVCRIRALRCALMLVDADTLSRISSKSVQELQEALKVFLYLAELDKIQMPHTLLSFSSANKEGLVRSIWKNHRHQIPGVKLLVNLCLDYKIYDLTIWNNLLQQMQPMQMLGFLHQVLLRLNGVPALWQIPNFSRYWLQVLLEPFKSVELPLTEWEKSTCVDSYRTLQRCPVDIDLERLVAEYARCALWPCAMGCALLMPGFEAAEILAQRSSEQMLLDLLAFNDMEQTLPLTSQIKAAIFDDIDAKGAYAVILKAEVFLQDFILHLMSSDCISGILKFTVQHSLLPEAFKLIRLYQCQFPESEFAVESEGAPPLDALKIYLKRNNFYEDLKMYLEVEDSVDDEVEEAEESEDSLFVE